ncbi:MAG: FAD binding domain-containing protein, partial [Chitinophagaceae bacterium]|nr:FAD binding domain-containing protein [Polaromonas sp.]
MTRSTPPAAANTQSLQFIRQGKVVSLNNVPPSRTLLDLLRDDLACPGTKEGCAEGDCGACTVVLADEHDGALRFRAVNSCIRMAHSINGMALWTVEDIAADPQDNLPKTDGGLGTQRAETGVNLQVHEDFEHCAITLPVRSSSVEKRAQADGGLGAQRAETGVNLQVHEDFEHCATTPPVRSARLHPAQAAMVNCHASQCGFCTPGFVMSLHALYQNRVCKGLGVTRAVAQEALSGNLCRCTGYQPILQAAQSMADFPRAAIDEADVLLKIKQLRYTKQRLQPDLTYKSPKTLAELLALKAKYPKAQLVAGCTDVGLWVNKQHRQFDHIIDTTQVKELRRIEAYPQHIAIGAAVTLHDAFASLQACWPQLHSFAARFAGLPVRNSGTLGGNVANGSPIGDSMPLLIAMGAHIVLMSHRGHREMPLEQLYTGYRQNVLELDEVLAWIKVPKPGRAHPNTYTEREGEGPLPIPVPSPSGGGLGRGLSEFLRIYKISKRFDDDISAVCLGLNLHFNQGVVSKASIGIGGVAATPVRAVKTEA